MWRSKVLKDPPVELTSAQRQQGLRAARAAAREARGSVWRTAGSQYRRYRATAGAAYLAWPQWHAEYLRIYLSRNSETIESGASNPWGGMPPGGGTTGGTL